MDVAEYIRNKNAETAKKRAEKKSPLEGLEKYAGYSEEQLMQELFRQGSLSEGKVSAQELDDFYKKARPYLSPEQAERMKELIIALKNN